MAYITKRGNSYSVRYTYEDEHGQKLRTKWEKFFPTKEEATNRKKQIEHELAAGTLQFQPMQRIPTKKTDRDKNRALTVQAPNFRGYITKKERQILRFDVQNLVHLAHSYPNFSLLSRLPRKRPFPYLPYN